MIDTKTLRRHAALVDEMARAQGLDLEEQALRGAVTIPEIEDAVLRCTGCTAPERCTAALAEARATPAPAYCRNHDFFDRLTR